MIDDSSLFHSTYDPVKAREYYLKNRKLKGRKPGSAKPSSTGRPGGQIRSVVTRGGGKPNRSNTKSRRAELLAQQAALEKRLDHLREVLKKLVAEAKGRSKSTAAPKKDEKGKAPETKSDKADRNADEKSKKPLTASQKSKKAKAAKEAYEKEKPNSLSTDVDILREQVKDIQAKIKKAVEDAAASKKKAKNSDSKKFKPKAKPIDGPKGR